MADFITRVELLGATSEASVLLDQAMAAKNFGRKHLSKLGVEYDLPAGTYFSQSDGMSAVDVRNLAAAAIRKIGFRYDIVTVSGDIAYFLHPAR